MKGGRIKRVEKYINTNKFHLTYGNGNLIGVPHSTVRFWDLCYFFDSRCFSAQMPRPWQIAINGNLMNKSYIDSGYNQNELVNVETLRYLYLNTNDASKKATLIMMTL